MLSKIFIRVFLFCYILTFSSCGSESTNANEPNLDFEIESVVGKWKIKRRSFSKYNNSNNNCNLYSIIFSSNNSFSIEFENTYVYGIYSSENNSEIILNVQNSAYGRLTNISINNNQISFSISISNQCDENLNASKDTDYIDDEECSLSQDVQIGNQIWMSKNLDRTVFNNGDPIPYEPNPERWKELNTPAYTFFNNDTNNISIYGLLYNWYALNDERGIFPEGYRGATKSDYEELTRYLGLEFIGDEDYEYNENKGIAEKLKSVSYWNTPNDNNNESCFNALPGGFLATKEDGFGGTGYGNLGGQGVFWTTTESSSDTLKAYYFILSYPSINQQLNEQTFSNNIAIDHLPKTQGFSVRCIRKN